MNADLVAMLHEVLNEAMSVLVTFNFSRRRKVANANEHTDNLCAVAKMKRQMLLSYRKDGHQNS